MRGKWSLWESEKQIYLWIIWWGEKAIGPTRKMSLYPLRASSAFLQNCKEMLFLLLFSLIPHSLCFPNVFHVLPARSHTPAAWSNRCKIYVYKLLWPWNYQAIRYIRFGVFPPDLPSRFVRRSTPSNITSYQGRENSKTASWKILMPCQNNVVVLLQRCIG